MKKLLSLLSIFSIFLSCSSDETSTPVTPPPAPIVKYTITLSAGEGGTVSTTGGEYEAGQTVSVTATPQGEYLFKDWSDGNTNATRTITVNSNTTLTANFEKRKYPLTINFDGEGEVIEEIINAGRTTEYDSGTTVKLTAQAADGWVFDGWSGNIDSKDLIIELVISEPIEINVKFIEIKTEILGQWNFNNDTTNKNPNTKLKDDDCRIHSLIINEDDTFKLYTNDLNGVNNYVTYGTYLIVDRILELYVEENGESMILGIIDDIQIVEGVISGNFKVDNICFDIKNGYEEASYSEEVSYIPDMNLEKWLVNEGYDDKIDSYILSESALSQQIIAIYATDSGYDESGVFCECYGDERFTNRLNSIAGIEVFKDIKILNLTGNKLDSINISKNKEVEYLYLNFNSIIKLNTNENIELKEISIDNNDKDIVVNFKRNKNLLKLSIASSGISSIDLTSNDKLEFLNLYDNSLTNITIHNQTKLKSLQLGKNQLSMIDVSNNSLLETIALNDNNLQGNLDISSIINLKELDVYRNPNLNKIIVNKNQYDAINSNSNNFILYKDIGVTLELSTTHDSGGSGHDSGNSGHDSGNSGHDSGGSGGGHDSGNNGGSSGQSGN